jgi:hypothetical protein
MELKTALLVGVVGVAVVAGGMYVYNQKNGGSAKMSPIEARLSTPLGITFQKVKVGTVTSIPGSSSDQQEQVTVYGHDPGQVGLHDRRMHQGMAGRSRPRGREAERAVVGDHAR